MVDTLDYDAWQASFGSNSVLAADGNNNGIVDAADYVIWRKHFTGFLTSSNRVAVPEAATGSLAISALLILCACWRTRFAERRDGCGKTLLA
jgi:hypothetical protein